MSALTSKRLDELLAAATVLRGTYVQVEADELAELVLGYQCLQAVSETLGGLIAPPEAIASGTDDSFGGTTPPRAKSSAGPAGKLHLVKTDSSLASLSVAAPRGRGKGSSDG